MRMDQTRERLREVIRSVAELTEVQNRAALSSTTSTATGGPDPVEQAEVRRELEALHLEKQALTSEILRMLGLRTQAPPSSSSPPEGLVRLPLGIPGAPRSVQDESRGFPRPDRARTFEPSSRPREQEALPRLLSSEGPQPRSPPRHHRPDPRLPWGPVDVGRRSSPAAGEGGEKSSAGERGDDAEHDIPLGVSRPTRLGSILPPPFPGSEASRSFATVRHRERRYPSGDPAALTRYYGGYGDERRLRRPPLLGSPSQSLSQPPPQSPSQLQSHSYSHSHPQSQTQQPWSYSGTVAPRGPDSPRWPEDERDRGSAHRGVSPGVVGEAAWGRGRAPGRGVAPVVDIFSTSRTQRSREGLDATSGSGSGSGGGSGGGVVAGPHLSSFSFRGESERASTETTAAAAGAGGEPYLQRVDSGSSTVSPRPSPPPQPSPRTSLPEGYVRSRASSPDVGVTGGRGSGRASPSRELAWQSFEARARWDSPGWEERRASASAGGSRWAEGRGTPGLPTLHHEALAEQRHHHEQLFQYRAFYPPAATARAESPPRVGPRVSLPAPDTYGLAAAASPLPPPPAVGVVEAGQASYRRMPGLALSAAGSAMMRGGEGMEASTRGRHPPFTPPPLRPPPLLSTQPLPPPEAAGPRWRSETLEWRDQRRQDSGDPPPASGASSSRGCQEPGCDRRPIYAYKGNKKAAFCARHRVAGMVDTRHPLCKNEQCTRQPSFGMEGDRRASYCAEHKLPAMINVSSRRCQHAGCLRHPNFGFPGDRRATYCSGHRETGMVDIVSRRCREPGCGRRPLYNLDGLRPVCCSQHKEPGMIDVVSTRCQEPGCFCHPSFGYPSDKKARRCARHRLENMEGVKGHRHKRRKEAASSGASSSTSASVGGPSAAPSASDAPVASVSPGTSRMISGAARPTTTLAAAAPRSTPTSAGAGAAGAATRGGRGGGSFSLSASGGSDPSFSAPAATPGPTDTPPSSG